MLKVDIRYYLDLSLFLSQGKKKKKKENKKERKKEKGKRKKIRKLKLIKSPVIIHQ